MLVDVFAGFWWEISKRFFFYPHGKVKGKYVFVFFHSQVTTSNRGRHQLTRSSVKLKHRLWSRLNSAEIWARWFWQPNMQRPNPVSGWCSDLFSQRENKHIACFSLKHSGQCENSTFYLLISHSGRVSAGCLNRKHSCCEDLAASESHRQAV